MTYKHIDFDESPVMRSLLKTAYRKGLIKEEKIEPIVKEASSPSFSISLSENIIKLCDGLRANGFNKYADEIEDKFITLKTAEAKYYDVSGEKGEDLVDCAHPDGSHKVEDATEEYGVIETIIDQHKKIVDITEKTPKGKFASLNEKIVEQCKVVLGTASSQSLGAEACQGMVKVIDDLFSLLTKSELDERYPSEAFADVEGASFYAGMSAAIPFTESKIMSLRNLLDMYKSAFANLTKEKPGSNEQLSKVNKNIESFLLLMKKANINSEVKTQAVSNAAYYRSNKIYQAMELNKPGGAGEQGAAWHAGELSGYNIGIIIRQANKQLSEVIKNSKTIKDKISAIANSDYKNKLLSATEKTDAAAGSASSALSAAQNKFYALGVVHIEEVEKELKKSLTNVPVLSSEDDLKTYLSKISADFATAYDKIQQYLDKSSGTK